MCEHEKENWLLRSALHDAINSPKGVVPRSAEPFYDPDRWYPPSMRDGLPKQKQQFSDR